MLVLLLVLTVHRLLLRCHIWSYKQQVLILSLRLNMNVILQTGLWVFRLVFSVQDHHRTTVSLWGSLARRWTRVRIDYVARVVTACCLRNLQQIREKQRQHLEAAETNTREETQLELKGRGQLKSDWWQHPWRPVRETQLLCFVIKFS